MALSWVKVTGAAADAGRDVYVNGNFIDPAGTVGEPFQVETGQDTFMLLRPDKSVERSVKARIELHDEENDPQIVDISTATAPAAAMTSAAAPRTKPRATPRGSTS